MIMILSKWLNSTIWPIEATLTDDNNPGEDGRGSNFNKGVLHIPQNSQTGTSPSDEV